MNQQAVHPGAYPPEYSQGYQQPAVHPGAYPPEYAAQPSPPVQEQAPPASRPAVHPGAFPPGYNPNPQDQASPYAQMQDPASNNPSYEEQYAQYQRANEPQNAGNPPQDDMEQERMAARNMSEEELKARIELLSQMEKEASNKGNPGNPMEQSPQSNYISGSLYNYGAERLTKKAPKTRVVNPITGHVQDTSEFSPGFKSDYVAQPQVATQQLQFGGEPRFTRANPKVMNHNPITGQNDGARRPPPQQRMQEYGNMAMRPY